jgi:hypothetical protein
VWHADKKVDRLRGKLTERGVWPDSMLSEIAAGHADRTANRISGQNTGRKKGKVTVRWFVGGRLTMSGLTDRRTVTDRKMERQTTY